VRGGSQGVPTQEPEEETEIEIEREPDALDVAEMAILLDQPEQRLKVKRIWCADQPQGPKRQSRRSHARKRATPKE
jgi:hypothetical protein